MATTGDNSRQVDSYRRKNILMLATLLATATYAAGFSPPGGVWQDTVGHLPGDPIMRSTHYWRYVVFFYFNAAAFALSLMVVVISLVLTACPKDRLPGAIIDRLLQLLMLTATLTFMAAYYAGACRDKFRIVVFCVLVAIDLFNGTLLYFLDDNSDPYNDKELRKLMAPLSMFALTITYASGLSTPGGFWDSAEGGHRPGEGILHGKLLHLFSYFNVGAFVFSLYVVFLVMWCRGPQVIRAAIGMTTTGLLGLIISYTVGSSRGRHTSVSVICSLCVAIGAYVVLHATVRQATQGTGFWKKMCAEVKRRLNLKQDSSDESERKFHRASSLVQLLAGLAVSVTYQAGLYPPGGVWQDGDKAGDPILLTTNAQRYKAFFYCNTVAFVASLLAIFLGQKSYLIKHHALRAAMILDLLGLIVAYAIGSCRDQTSSMYAVGIAGAAVVYVVVHVQYFTLGSTDKDISEQDNALVDKKGGRFLLFAILVASITYQAGLTPPGGFLLQDDIQSGHRAGDPVLLYNYPRRYKAFFYCNSVSFMLSTVLILLLVNPNLYRPAIRSHALSLCSAVSFICLIGAFAAGSTQHLKTSIYIFVLAAVAFFLCLLLLLPIYLGWGLEKDPQTPKSGGSSSRRTKTRTRIYLMTLAILVGSVTYQAGLDPPGGSWQSTRDGHDAGNPVMHDNRRTRYLAFLCGNSTAFVASIYLIELLLFSMSSEPASECKWWEAAIEATVMAQYLGFLVAYAAGSSRQWKTSAHVGTLVIAVLAYVATHVMLSIRIEKRSENSEQPVQGCCPCRHTCHRCAGLCRDPCDAVNPHPEAQT